MNPLHGILEKPKTFLDYISDNIENEVMSQMIPVDGIKTIHIIEGDVFLWDQEGGFSDSSVEIKTDDGNCDTFAQRIAKLYGIEITCRKSPELNGKLGRFRITIEKID